MRGFIAPTDHDWWRFLRARPELGEVNFWRPGGTAFGALDPGEPFLFKLKAPHNAIGGFGFFARFARLPVWHAWDVFGAANGAPTEADLVARLGRLASRPLSRADLIGCIAVTTTVFFAPDDWVDQPADWSRQIVSGRTYDLTRGEGARVWAQCLQRAAAQPHDGLIGQLLDAQRRGAPQLVEPRLGQASFRLAVLDAYGGACAVTGEHSLPVLEAAHIRPWAAGGAHELTNGLPLRRDLHRLFDLGFVTVQPDLRLRVSDRLRQDYANGRTYYALDRQQIARPSHPDAAPDPDVLAWHNDSVFLG